MPKRKEESEVKPKTDEEIQEEINLAAAAVAKKLQNRLPPQVKPQAVLEQVKDQTKPGQEEEDEVEEVTLRTDTRQQEYKMHEILSYLQDKRYLPGNSRLGADMILPAAMNLAISHYLEDDRVDLLEEFFSIFLLAMRSLQGDAFNKTMDLGKSMLHGEFANSEQSLRF